MLRKAQHPFYLADGKALWTIEELKDILEQMDDLFYQHYVNPYKNDFSTWIDHEFHEHELAEALRYKSREKAIVVLHDWLAQKKQREKERAVFFSSSQSDQSVNASLADSSEKNPQKNSPLRNQSRNEHSSFSFQSSHHFLHESHDPVSNELAAMEKTLAALESAIEQMPESSSLHKKTDSPSLSDEEVLLNDMFDQLSYQNTENNRNNVMTNGIRNKRKEKKEKEKEKKEDAFANQGKNKSTQKSSLKPKRIILEDALLKKQEVVPLEGDSKEELEKASFSDDQKKQKGQQKSKAERDNSLGEQQSDEPTHIVDFNAVEETKEPHETKQNPQQFFSSELFSESLPSSPVTERMQYLVRKIQELNKKITLQQRHFLNHQEEVALLRKTLERKERELENYQRNLKRLAEENKSLTTAYVKLKEKEHFLQRLELAAREKLKRASLLFDQLNHLLKQKGLLEDEIGNLKKGSNVLRKKAAKETHELLRDEITAQTLPQDDALLDGAVEKEEEDLYDLDMMEQTIEQLTKKINQALADHEFMLQKKKTF